MRAGEGGRAENGEGEEGRGRDESRRREANKGEGPGRWGRQVLTNDHKCYWKVILEINFVTLQVFI